MATPRKDDGRGRATVRTSLVATVLLAGALILAACGSSGDGDSSGASGAEDELQVSTANWETDFSKSSVPLAEFRGGGPPKDGIPSIDDPKFVSVEEADGFLEGKEPIAVLEVGGKVRGYPIQILTWHEIVNDEIAGEPVAVTFCPLCNSTVAFSRDVGGETLEFGTTGNLRRSDLVMYDRTTESWWQQLTAEAVVGELTGETLEVLPSQIVSWNDFQQVNADAEVLSQDTGFSRSYGQNPYAGYDADADSQPFLLDQEVSDALPPKERVTAVQVEGQEPVVYPFPRLADDAPINDEIGGDDAVVLYDPEVASALDEATIADAREVGSAAVFERAIGGRTLTFEAGPDTGTFRDEETGSTWNFSGEAVSGELEGERLTPIPSDDQFWFALAAFFEDPDIRS